MAFKHLIENKTICVNEGELIVGERGPVRKAVPTYPELFCHSLQDLDVVSGRAKVPFIVCLRIMRRAVDALELFDDVETRGRGGTN